MDVWQKVSESMKHKMVFVSKGDPVEIYCEKHFDRPVLGKILILSRKHAEQFTYDKPWACISISDKTYPFTAHLPYPEIHTENLVDLLQLRFDDITDQRPGWVEFSESHAQQIWKFVDKVWDKVDLLMIHCHAGLSRSPACGKVIAEKYDPELSGFYNEMYFPNILVQNVMRKVADLWPYA